MTLVWDIACAAEVAISLLLFVRVAAGPSVSDRIVALNVISTQLTLAILAFSVAADRSIYTDTAIWLVSFSYLGALVWARFLERGLL
ncbi:MAG TPA: monovalent cation/H+ antiporter complex subunit F [Micromonosporaceae bacterium]|jgi:multicomponent Na+:H+ antiporter subunit F